METLSPAASADQAASAARGVDQARDHAAVEGGPARVADELVAHGEAEDARALAHGLAAHAEDSG